MFRVSFLIWFFSALPPFGASNLLSDTVDRVASSFQGRTSPKKVLHLVDPGLADEDQDWSYFGRETCQDPSTCESLLSDSDADPHHHTMASESSYHDVKSPATLVDDRTLGSDLGETQVASGEEKAEIYLRIDAARAYIRDEVMVEARYENVRGMCQNKHSNCAFWAVAGECEANPAYMLVRRT